MVMWKNAEKLLRGRRRGFLRKEKEKNAMKRYVDLTPEECNSIVISLLEEFKNNAKRLDCLALDEPNERIEFDILLELGALIQKIADVRDKTGATNDCCNVCR